MSSMLIATRWAAGLALFGSLGCGSSGSASPTEAGASPNDAFSTPLSDASLGADVPGRDESDSAASTLSDAPSAPIGDSGVTGFPPTFTKFGNVGVVWRHTSANDSTVAQAIFQDFGAVGSECTTMTLGACLYVSCPPAEGGARLPEGDPGTIMMGTAPSQLTLMYSGPNVGDGITSPMALWPPGTHIPMVSDGSSAVPPWSATVTMPSIATVTAPALPDGGAFTIARTNALSVTWQGAPQLLVGLALSTNGYEQLACTLSGGAGVVPASALGLLTPGSYDLQFFTADRAYVSAGDWWIRATVDVLAACAGGICETFNAVVQ